MLDTLPAAQMPAAEIKTAGAILWDPNMHINKSSVICLLLFMAAPAFAQAKRPEEKRTATSSLEFKRTAGKTHTVIRNQRFSVVNICVRACSDYVLQEAFYSDQEEGAEGGLFEVTAVASAQNEPAKSLWTIHASGDEAGPWNDFYRVILHGCCGDTNTLEYYALPSGKKVYSASSDEEHALLSIEVPNTPIKRYVAFSQAAAKPEGRLQFGDEERVRQVVTVKQPSQSRPPEISLRRAGKPDAANAQLWSGNGDRSAKAVSGVTVVLKFGSVTALIPIENDRLAVEKAQMPKGYRISE